MSIGRRIGAWLAVIGAAAALAGCSDPGVVRFHVIYSTDVKSWIDSCT
jgi:hypothetical protein